MRREGFAVQPDQPAPTAIVGRSHRGANGRNHSRACTAAYVARDESRLGAVAWPWRDGANAGDLAGRADAISGNFVSTAIRWSLARGAAEQVLRFLADAVNAVALLRDGRAATAGADGRIDDPHSRQDRARCRAGRPYRGNRGTCAVVRQRHPGFGIVGSERAAVAAGGTPRVLEGQTKNVNGVAFAPDRRTLVSVSYDQSVRIWLLADTTSPMVVVLPTPLNVVAVAGDGEIAARGADGRVYFLNGDNTRTSEVAAGPRPERQSRR